MNKALSAIKPAPEQIVEQYGSSVTNICKRMIRDRELAEDTAQEIWYEVIHSLDSFEGNSSFSTWLYTIARRTIYRHIHKEKTYSVRFLNRFFDEHADNGMEELFQIPEEDRLQWFRLECDACLTAIIHCLDNDNRMVYLMRLLTDLSYSELSEVLEQKEESIRQRFSRASRKVNCFLSDHCTLYNPAGRCRCKMDKPIRYLDLQEDYKKIRKHAKTTLFLQKAGEYHKIKNLWKELP